MGNGRERRHLMGEGADSSYPNPAHQRRLLPGPADPGLTGARSGPPARRHMLDMRSASPSRAGGVASCLLLLLLAVVAAHTHGEVRPFAPGPSLFSPWTRVLRPHPPGLLQCTLRPHNRLPLCRTSHPPSAAASARSARLTARRQRARHRSGAFYPARVVSGQPPGSNGSPPTGAHEGAAPRGPTNAAVAYRHRSQHGEAACCRPAARRHGGRRTRCTALVRQDGRDAPRSCRPIADAIRGAPTLRAVPR